MTHDYYIAFVNVEKKILLKKGNEYNHDKVTYQTNLKGHPNHYLFLWLKKYLLPLFVFKID